MSFDQALKHFKKVDPILYELGLKIAPLPEIVPSSHDKYFDELCESIVSQQLSIRVADVIWQRVLDLFLDKDFSPQNVVNVDFELLRKCGLSNAKATYIKDLASKILDRSIELSKLENLTELEIIKELVKVKGIGPWTAEMFLMFTMGKPDVFSYGDLGLKNARAMYPTLKDPELWSPYGSYASRILWKSLELKDK